MAYLPLSTANLPDPVINPAQGASPEDYFNTVLYTGNGSTQSITGVGFQPDLLWLKERNSTGYPIIQNSISGVQKELYTNVTNAENSVSNGIQSFDSDGWTVGSDGWQNGSGDSMVAWLWKANGSGVSNTDGSITSTVSANTTSGFSIGTYTGTGAVATVGHGLSQAPEMIIIKDRPTVNDWPVYHASVGATAFLKLNATNAQATDSGLWNNTAPTASWFTLGSSNLANNNTKSHVFYAFHSVDGFSKFGSYVGNGSTDGPFIYCGFRPAFVMVKHINGTQDWHILDSERGSYNVIGPYLYANSSGSENNAAKVDFLSNGFKIRVGDNAMNSNGNTLIYMAFAENPFKYSNAR